MKRVEIPTHIGKKKITHTAHKADKIRMDVLSKKGGVYMDIDTISIRPYKKLLNNEIVLGKEVDGICNAIMLTKSNSKFLSIWIQNYEKYFQPFGWNESSSILPSAIARDLPHRVTLVEKETFFIPNWNETDKIFEKPNEIHPSLITLHLWETYSSDYLKEIKDWGWCERNPHTLYGKIMLELMKKIK